jgi:hypothetical protein
MTKKLGLASFYDSCKKRPGLIFFVLLFLCAARAAAAAEPLRGLAIEETVGSSVPASTGNFPVAAHLEIDLARLSLPTFDARLAQYRARTQPVILVLHAPNPADLETWRTGLRALVERERGKVAGYQFGPASTTLPDAAQYAFFAKQTSTLIRSIDQDASVAIGPIPVAAADWLTRVYAEGIAPYVDDVAIAGPITQDDEGFRAAVERMSGIVEQQDPTSGVWLGPIVIGGPAASAGRAIVESMLRSAGSRVSLTIVQGPAGAIDQAIAAAGRLRGLFTGELVALDQQSIHWRRGGTDVTPHVSSRLLYSTSGGGTYLIYRTASAAAALDLEADVSMSSPAAIDPFTGVATRLTPPARERGQPAKLTVRAGPATQVIDFNYGQPTYASAAEARRETLPPVEEIIAREQAAQTAQDAALHNYAAHLRIEMHFHPSAADPAYNIVTENALFADAGGAEWAEQSFSLNGATWTSNRPSFPLLQPEKVLSLPLDLRLTADYRYRLTGVETVDGRAAFVVAFDPVVESKALYRGTVWIDRQTFARLRVSAVETRGAGVVQSNEEEQEFAIVGEMAGRAIRLPTHLTSRQTMLVAGRTILNEREQRLTEVRLNPADFDAMRSAARRGNQVMYRDTEAGVRYLVKRGETRVVSENLTTSTKAFAMGADIDPSFDYPLPIAGLDILDFNFLNHDLQLALLFGGVIAIGNVQRAGLWNGRVDASVDFFGIALNSNDSVFDGSGEKRGERVLSRPASAGFNAGIRLSPSHKIIGRVELRHDSYSRADLTAADFVVPSSTTTLGAGAGYEFRRRGYSVTANAAAYRRSAWTPWGAGAFDAETRTYTRYDAGVSKDFVFSTFQTVHLNGQYFGGRRLDRFSMYQFGLFDATRMHGVPSAVRFADLAMARGSYSFNLFDQYRLDLFLDQAVGRDAAGGSWQSVTGVGASVTLRGPRSTLFRADVGRSRLPSMYRGAGSTVVQIMILKPL